MSAKVAILKSKVPSCLLDVLLPHYLHNRDLNGGGIDSVELEGVGQEDTDCIGNASGDISNGKQEFGPICVQEAASHLLKK